MENKKYKIFKLLKYSLFVILVLLVGFSILVVYADISLGGKPFWLINYERVEESQIVKPLTEKMIIPKTAVTSIGSVNYVCLITKAADRYQSSFSGVDFTFVKTKRIQISLGEETEYETWGGGKVPSFYVLSGLQPDDEILKKVYSYDEQKIRCD